MARRHAFTLIELLVVLAMILLLVGIIAPALTPVLEIARRQKCAANRDDPWLLGYFLDNELEWFGKNHKVEGLFDEAWKKSAEHSAKQAWIAFLKKELSSIAAFNEIFGTAFSDFEELAADVQPQTPRNMAGQGSVRTK